MVDRTTLILDSLARHGLSPFVRLRIEYLLDGREDRKRLRCCNGGCVACVYLLLAVVEEVEAAERGDRLDPTSPS